MSKKNFDEFKAKTENYSDFQQPTPIIDPNLHVNSIAYKEIRNKNLFIYAVSMIGRSFFTAITAPLTTLQVSLQLSVLEHQNKYGDINEFEKKDIMKVPKELTPYDKRRYELIVKSGVTGTNKPFRAPVYLNYKEAYKALSNQGILGFYKGNGVGLVHLWMNSYAKYSLMNALDLFNYTKQERESVILKAAFTLASVTFIDLVTHPLQLMQSRFILQNRLPNFRTYASAFHFFKKHMKSLHVLAQGMRVHLPKNLLLTGGYVTIYKENPLLSFIIANTISETLAYPLTTILRRLHCQDKLPGMLPERYSGVWHAFKLITYEEGIRGLYRGYLAFLPAHMINSFLLLTIKITAEHAFSLKAEPLAE